jgi:hypothetical protein
MYFSYWNPSFSFRRKFNFNLEGFQFNRLKENFTVFEEGICRRMTFTKDFLKKDNDFESMVDDSTTFVEKKGRRFF